MDVLFRMYNDGKVKPQIDSVWAFEDVSKYQQYYFTLSSIEVSDIYILSTKVHFVYALCTFGPMLYIGLLYALGERLVSCVH